MAMLKDNGSNDDAGNDNIVSNEQSACCNDNSTAANASWEKKQVAGNDDIQ